MKLAFQRLRVDAGGEGSKGGHVVGHTTSGKPIYMGKKPGKPFSKNMHISTEPDSFADQHTHWNARDHEQAADALSSHAKAFPRTAKVKKLHEQLASEKGKKK